MFGVCLWLSSVVLQSVCFIWASLRLCRTAESRCRGSVRFWESDWAGAVVQEGRFACAETAHFGGLVGRFTWESVGSCSNQICGYWCQEVWKNILLSFRSHLVFKHLLIFCVLVLMRNQFWQFLQRFPPPNEITLKMVYRFFTASVFRPTSGLCDIAHKCS